MASLRGALRYSCAFLPHWSTPLPPPASLPSAKDPSWGCAPRRCRLPHALLRTISSLAVEHGCAVSPPVDSEVAEPEVVEEGGDSKKRRGLGTLHSLFAQPSSSRVPVSTGGAAGDRSARFPSRFAGSRLRMRPMESAGSGSSAEGDRAWELSPEMALLIRRLCEEGYLKNASFAQELDSRRVVNDVYARGVLTAVAQRFGEDHQEIAKWLSGSSLKKVALSGCPCTERKTVFAAKRMRSFFWIQEDVVCRGCMKKTSCKFANQTVNREEKLILADVMRVLAAYAWDYAAHGRKFVGEELNHSVNKSLKEVIALSG